ncbi:unnamed protein product [Meganyctiphanes norvegica]|uniref:Apolipoprotein D n=1 Tax=Meganyctiphanes norvegica TaxID=48144 RepID=A0AAV2RJ75_MEGNR
MPGFNIDQFSGTWYHILKFPSEQGPFKTCVRTTFTSNAADGMMDVVRKGRSIPGNPRGVARRGVMAPLPGDNTGAMQIDIDGLPPQKAWVVYTDYTGVACLYSCTEFPGLRVDTAIAMARSARPLVKLVSQCRGRLHQFKINVNKFVRVPQAGKCYNRNKTQDHSGGFGRETQALVGRREEILLFPRNGTNKKYKNIRVIKRRIGIVTDADML